MSSGGRVMGLDHVSVTVDDLERSLRFYRDLLGLRVRDLGELSGEDVSAVTGFAGARFRYADVDLGGGQILELLEYLEPEGTPLSQRTCDPGSGHIAFVVDDIDELYVRLIDAGVAVRSGPVTIEEADDSFAVRVTHTPEPAGAGIQTTGSPLDARERRAVEADSLTIEESGDWAGVRVLYALDPDGVTVELVQRPDRDARRDRG